ncbi:hypothetical protein OWV82_006765 [Melia azedarach]|uniref:Uncharacterized protein n=1 Tax=Melia azedarach TaxID=155640 RepID=A0ACC1YIT5_MELAZ|nr:hypothetical protein OWV82_006765 [Melia azedarach]
MLSSLSSFFWRFIEEKRDFLLDKPRLRAAIRTDLQLLENQLPYSLLEGLFEIAFPETKICEYSSSLFFLLSCAFFYDRMFNKIPDNGEVKHFVDLRRKAITRTHPESFSTTNNGIPASAFKLQESGVKFTHIAIRELLDIKFEKKKGRIPRLQVRGELKIPKITVDDWTECLIRNVMALEQCHYPLETHVCNYIALLDDLINTKEDVHFLVEAGIISNRMGNTARLTKMFNNLGQQIGLSSSCYGDIVNGLTAHYEDPWNHAMATLKTVYFGNYWRSTGTIAAIVLLLLTLIQTVCSILQVM